MTTKDNIYDLLKNYKTFPEEVQKKLGRDRAIVYTVYSLEKNNIEPTFQRVCVVSSKLFSESFSFPEFPEFPDSRIVRNCLWHCVDNHKGWLVGSDKTKYSVTKKGHEIVEIFEKLLNNNMAINSLPLEFQSKGVTRKAMVTKPQDKEENYLKEILSSKAYKNFLNNQKNSSLDIKKSLGGDRYSPESYLMDRLKNALGLCNDKKDKLYSYLCWIKDNWKTIMEE